MYNTQEQEKDRNGEKEDKKDQDDDKNQERMYQMEYEEAEREFGTPDEGNLKIILNLCGPYSRKIQMILTIQWKSKQNQMRCSGQ